MRRYREIITALLPLSTLACQRERLEPWNPQPQHAPAADVDYAKPLPPGALALRKIPLEAWPDLSRAFGDDAGLEDAIRQSLAYFDRPSSHARFPYGEVTHAQARASLIAMLEILDQAKNARSFVELIRARFDLYQSVGWDGRGRVHVTGYYTPIFEGRRTRDERFRYPLYRLPRDLIKDERGRTLGRRLPNGQLVPYPTREEIDRSQLLRGDEIAWLTDPFEAYVVNVQGSARLRLETGDLLELGYAGNNGHAYASVGHALVEDGRIAAAQLSLQAMIAYFRQNPTHVWPYIWKNDRFVFFQESRGGPFGSINVPVTKFRTVATDKAVFPAGCLAFLDTRLPVRYEGRLVDRPYSGFALDQDTGGAIRAAGRCDLYFGVGDGAAELAGTTAADGRLYYLFLRDGRTPRMATRR